MNNDLQVAHPHSGSSSTWFLVELEFGNVGLWGEGKTWVPGEKPLGAKERTNNILNPHMASTPGVEPAPRWWEASALTTAHAPPLIERRLCYDYRFSIPNRDRSQSRKNWSIWSWRSRSRSRRSNLKSNLNFQDVNKPYGISPRGVLQTWLIITSTIRLLFKNWGRGA